MHAVVVVVWVSIGIMLVTIESEVAPIQIVLWLQSLWQRSSLLQPNIGLKSEIWDCNSKEEEDWQGGVLLRDHSVHERLLEANEELLGRSWLHVTQLVILRQPMILHDSLE